MDGLYLTQFTPDKDGVWLVTVSCTSRPYNINAHSYFVSEEYEDNLAGETPCYVSKVINVAVGSNKIFCNLFNSTTQLIKIHKVIINSSMQGLLTGQQISFLLRRTSTVGTGTNDNIGKLDSLAPTLPAGITFKYALTVNPTLVSGGEIVGGSLNCEESNPASKQLVLFESKFGLSPIFIRQNEGICVVQDLLASAGKISIFFYWTTEQ